MYRYIDRSGVSRRKEGRNSEKREAVKFHPAQLPVELSEKNLPNLYLNLPPQTVASVNKTILRNTDGAVKQDLSIFDVNVSSSM